MPAFPTGSPIPSVVTLGTTLYANKVHLSYGSVSATNGCNHQTVGKVHAGSILALESSELHTVFFHSGGGQKTFPYNFADLHEPIPWSALAGQPLCALGGCPTWYYGEMYYPRIAVPTQIRNLDAAWQSCDFPLEGHFDPPQALGTVDVLTPAGGNNAQKTPAPEPKATPASPAGYQTPTPTGNTAKPGNTNATPSSMYTPGAVISLGSGPVVSVNSNGGVVVGAEDHKTTMSVGQTEIIGGVTIHVGVSDILIAGSTGTQTYIATAAAVTPPIVLSANGKEYSLIPLTGSDKGVAPTAVVVGSYTLSANANPITMADGSKLSYESGVLVVNGTTTLKVAPAQPIPSMLQIPHYPEVVIGSVTLSVGGTAATINGQVMSAAPNGVVINGSSTLNWNKIPVSTTATSAAGVGDYIAIGLGGSASAEGTVKHDASVAPMATSNLAVTARDTSSLAWWVGPSLFVLSALWSA